MESATVKAAPDQQGDVVLDPAGMLFAPQSAMLGTWSSSGGPEPKMWMDPVTENPAVGAVESWNIRNFTMDAHPIHIHLVQFQVVKRVVTDPTVSPHGRLGAGASITPEKWETGWKDTVVVYPGEYTRVKARFDTAGLFVWHCHILEHEDNENDAALPGGAGPPLRARWSRSRPSEVGRAAGRARRSGGAACGARWREPHCSVRSLWPAPSSRRPAPSGRASPAQRRGVLSFGGRSPIRRHRRRHS